MIEAILIRPMWKIYWRVKRVAFRLVGSDCIPVVCREKHLPNCSMNIYAPKGHKVRITKRTMLNGTQSAKDKVLKYLKVGKIYTIEKTEVSSSHTGVYLQEFEGVRFNSVMFVDVCKVDERVVLEHPGFKYYFGDFTSPRDTKVLDEKDLASYKNDFGK